MSQLKNVLVCLTLMSSVACGPGTDSIDDGPSDAVSGEDSQGASDDETLASVNQGLGGPCGSTYRTLVAHNPIRARNSTTVLSYLDVYRSTTGRYCAVNMATSATWGKSMWRSVYKTIDSGGTYGRSYDKGYYRYYAGPVYSARTSYTYPSVLQIYAATVNSYSSATYTKR